MLRRLGVFRHCCYGRLSHFAHVCSGHRHTASQHALWSSVVLTAGPDRDLSVSLIIVILLKTLYCVTAFTTTTKKGALQCCIETVNL